MVDISICKEVKVDPQDVTLFNIIQNPLWEMLVPVIIDLLPPRTDNVHHALHQIPR